MGLVARASVWNTGLSYAGIGLGYINTVLLFPIWMGASEFGVVRLLITFSVMYAQFSAIGMHAVVLRYAPALRTETPNEAYRPYNYGGLFSWAAAFATFGFALCTLLYLVFQSWIEDRYELNSPLFVNYATWLIPMAGLTLAFNMLEAYARAAYRTILPTALREVGQRILQAAGLVLFHFKVLNFDGFLAFFIASLLIPVAMLTYDLVRRGVVRPVGIPKWPAIDRKERLTYGLYSFASGASFYFVQGIDVAMLGSIVGSASVAMYTIYFFLATAISVPSRATARILMPLIAEATENGDRAGIADLYRRSSIGLLAIGLFLYTGLWAIRPALNELITSDKPDALNPSGFGVVMLIGAAYLADMATSANGMILSASKKYRIDAYLNVGLMAIAALLNYFLIPLWGIVGAGVATFTALTLYNGVRWSLVWKWEGFQPLSRLHLLITLGTGIIIVGLGFLPIPGGPWARSAVRVVLACGGVAGLLLALKVPQAVGMQGLLKRK